MEKVMALPFEIENVIIVAGDLYAKTPEALAEALEKLKETGYQIEDQRTSESRQRDGVSVEQMEKNGWSMWYASLRDIRRGKCNSCNSYISVGGIQSHGHKCEVCGEVTYYKVIDGSSVIFEFRDPTAERVFISQQVQMKVKRWDTEAAFLYLYPDPEESRKWGALTGEQAKAYLEKYKDKWELVEEDGQRYIRIHYPESFYVQPDDVISMIDTMGHYWNHSIVKVWEGVEYHDFDHFPIPESIHVYETWHWAPLHPSPTLHERLLRAIYMVSDQGYYYQDGRAAFSQYHLDEIGKFVRHFTTLDADAYDQAKARFRLSGPGFIADLARFCHEQPQIENQPNIGNAIVGLSKIMSRQALTEEEAEAMIRGAEAEPDLFGGMVATINGEQPVPEADLQPTSPAVTTGALAGQPVYTPGLDLSQVSAGIVPLTATTGYTSGDLAGIEEDQQRAIAESTTWYLARIANLHGKEFKKVDAREPLEVMGFTVKGQHGDLFYEVVPPQGWSKTTQGHWTTVVDEAGRERFTQFFKGAIYEMIANLDITISEPLSKEEYFELEERWEMVDDYESKRTDVIDEWQKTLAEVEDARREHPDWYEEYKAKKEHEA